jgi:ATP adenylyltransferase
MHGLDTLEVAKQEGRAPWTDVQLETKEFVVYNDGFPVTPGHALIVPRESNLQNLLRCFNYAMQMGNANVEGEGNEITGFNVGINVGSSAGQTVMYPHVHLIFRRDGDTKDPTGGVRNVIPGSGNYDNQ